MRVNYIPRLSLNPPPVPCRNPGSRAKTDRNSRAVGCERTRSRPGPFRVASGLLCACHRHYSGRFDGACLLVYPDRQRPSRCDSPVGSCNCSFGACSAFTRVRASTLAESPGDPLLRKSPNSSLPHLPLQWLPGGASQFPGGSHSRWRFWDRVERTVQRLSRRPVAPTVGSARDAPWCCFRSNLKRNLREREGGIQ